MEQNMTNNMEQNQNMNAFGKREGFFVAIGMAAGTVIGAVVDHFVKKWRNKKKASAPSAPEANPQTENK